MLDDVDLLEACMDSANLLVFGGILAAVGLVVLALRRSWGNFSALPPIPDVANAASNPWLVRIEHNLVQQAAEQALRKGGKAAQRIVRSGPDLYFSFEYIADEGERRRSVDLMRRLQSGQDADVWAGMRLVRDMFRE
jgi:hypothetical protein